MQSLEMVDFSEDLTGKYKSYLNDESGIFKQGSAERIYFPHSEDKLVEIVYQAIEQSIPITISGGGTGISGGRAPIGGWVIATDRMCSISKEGSELWKDPETRIEYEIYFHENQDGSGSLTVPIAMTVKAIQNFTREIGWYYPPDPTERSSFIGGNVNTNASGARSFKYGPTRDWVQAIKVILPNGEKLTLTRGTSRKGKILLQNEKYEQIIPELKYPIPKVSKNVAGPIINSESDPIDIFIGSDGLFGIVTQVTLKVIQKPKSILTFFAFCNSRETGLGIIEICQSMKLEEKELYPMSVELLDERAIEIMRRKDQELPNDAELLIIIEQDVNQRQDVDEIIRKWFDIFTENGLDDILLAQTYSEIEHFKELRHVVPETVNSIVRSYGQAKIGSDLSVPWKETKWLFNRCWELGKYFENYQNDRSYLDSFGYALWAHAGDAHVHLNLIPRDVEEYQKGNEIILGLIKEVIAKGGSMAAEHGLGKKYFDGKPALEYQIGVNGLEEIRNIKKLLDPKFLLNRGNLLGYNEYL